MESTFGRAATLFGSNAFSSPVGQQIERATDSSLPSEDWALILEICDIINETDEGPKDAIKAIRKRLANQKNYKSILYTLTVSEACVKNCGPRFHKHVATKDFLNDFTRLLGQKGQASTSPQVVQEKVLSLIQSWSDAFRNAPELQSIKMCYDSLKDQGYEFPAQDLDKLSPIFTPNLVSQTQGSTREVIPSSDSAAPPLSQGNTNRMRTFAPSPHYQPSTVPRANTAPAPQTLAPINPTVEQLGKLRSELDIVEGNVQVLSEMLTQLQPGQESPDDYELLVELNTTCREMQKRMQVLVDRIANEEVTGVLLRVNDNLNNVFIRYDRYDRSRKGLTGELGNTELGPPPVVETAESTSTVDNLIEFNREEPSFATSYIQNNEEEDEFAEFAQSRTIVRTPERDIGSTYEDNIKGVPNEGSISDVMCARGPYPYLPRDANGDKDMTLEDDIEDVEKWLKETDLSQLEAEERAARQEALKAAKPHTVQTSETSKPMTSSEFDKFLSDRAMVGSQSLPQQPPRQPAPAPRQMTNVISGERSSEEMYGL